MEQSVIKYFSLIREYIEPKNFDAGTKEESKPIDIKDSRLDLLFKLLDRMNEVLKDDFSLTWDYEDNKNAVRNFITKKLSANFPLNKDSMIKLCLALNNGTSNERFFNGCWVVRENGPTEFAEQTKTLSIVWLTAPSDGEPYPVLVFPSDSDPNFRSINFPDEAVHAKINEKAKNKINYTLNTDASVYAEVKADRYPILKFYRRGAPTDKKQLEKLYDDKSEKPQAIDNNNSNITGAMAKTANVGPLLKVTEQGQRNNCLQHTVAAINAYLRDKHIHLQYAERGDPRLAECVIDFYGRQFRPDRTKVATYIRVNTNRAKAAYDYINECLDRKLPVLVGLNYRTNRFMNNDGVTDHFSAIVGRRIDKNNGVHFILADSRDGKLKFLDVKENYEIRSAQNSDPVYQVTQVRAYSKNDFQNVTGKRLTTADDLPTRRITA